MKRLHVHVAVTNLEDSVRFYSALFGAQPTVLKDDYAKWMVDDPRVNFAISSRGQEPGLDHLGIQTENDTELEEINARLAQAALPIQEQSGTACCYAESDKYWTVDPQGLAWEAFHSLGSIPVFGEAERGGQKNFGACCVPSVIKIQPKKSCC